MHAILVCDVITVQVDVVMRFASPVKFEFTNCAYRVVAVVLVPKFVPVMYTVDPPAVVNELHDTYDDEEHDKAVIVGASNVNVGPVDDDLPEYVVRYTV